MLRLLRRRRESGSSIVEFTLLGILFLVPMIWLVLGVFEVQRGMFGVAAASREATRAFVLSDNYDQAASRARQAAALALRDQGIDLNAANASISGPRCTNGPCLSPGSFVEYTVSYNVPLPFIPQFFDWNRPSVGVENTHISPYGEYRQNRG